MKRKTRKEKLTISKGNLISLIEPFMRQLKIVSDDEEVIDLMLYPLEDGEMHHMDYTIKKGGGEDSPQLFEREQVGGHTSSSPTAGGEKRSPSKGGSKRSSS